MNDTPTYAMLADMRALIAERELTAATELWSEARADAEKAKAYKKVLKTTNANLKRERDKARDHREKLLEILQNVINQRATIIAQRDEAVNNYESAQLLSIRVGEQRDRLAEALEQLMTYQPRSTVIAMNEHHVWRNAKEALQSLTSNTINDDPRRKSEKENR